MRELYTEEEDIIIFYILQFRFTGLSIRRYRELRDLFNIRSTGSYRRRRQNFRFLNTGAPTGSSHAARLSSRILGSFGGFPPIAFAREVNRIIDEARGIRATPPPITDSDAVVAARIGLSELAVNYLRR